MASVPWVNEWNANAAVPFHRHDFGLPQVTIDSNIGPAELAQQGLQGQHSARKVIKNSLANVVTGLSIALTTILVPPVLARTLTPLKFGAWSLVLQFAGYVKVLDLGMQGAVGRYVAYYLARSDQQSAREFASTAISLLTLVAAMGLTAILVAALHLHLLFPQMPLELVKSTSLAMGLVGVTASIGLPASVFRGILVGIERNELVTLIVAPMGLVLCGALIFVGIVSRSIVDLAFTYSGITLLSYGLYWRISNRYAHLQVTPSHFRRSIARETVSYCSTTMIWSAAMLLISGFDVAIVGRVDFRHVAVYAACVAPITILAGAQNAMFGPMLQVGARNFAHGSTLKLRDLLERATRISMLVNLAYVVPLFILSHQILTLWLGGRYAKQGTLILRLLLVGHAIRLVATPYANLLLATGQHHRARIAPIVESAANVTAAVLLGIRYGAVGVAAGVIIGAVVAQLLNYLYNFPRTQELIGDRNKLVWEAIVVPLACFSPLALLCLPEQLAKNTEVSVVLDVLVTMLVLTLIWKVALGPADRRLLLRTKSMRAD